jgi:hypothetical protein
MTNPALGLAESESLLTLASFYGDQVYLTFAECELL